MNTPTPKTDAAWDDSDPLHKLSDNEKKEFARKLEQERDEAKTQLAAWHSQFGTTQLSHAVAVRDTDLRQVEQLKRDKEMLDRILLLGLVLHPDPLQGFRRLIDREAISAALKPA